MRRWITLTLLATLILSSLLVSHSLSAQDATPEAGSLSLGLGTPDASPVVIPTPQVSSPGITLYAGGLENPRGMAWDSDGTMYVATTGTGGSRPPRSSVPDSCDAAAPLRGSLARPRPRASFKGRARGESRCADLPCP